MRSVMRVFASVLAPPLLSLGAPAAGLAMQVRGQAPPPPMGQEIEIPLLGIKVKSVPATGFGQASQVTAVLIGGPAHRRGVVPGSYLWNLSCTDPRTRRSESVSFSGQPRRGEAPDIAVGASAEIVKLCGSANTAGIALSGTLPAPGARLGITDLRSEIVELGAMSAGGQWLTGQDAASVANASSTLEEAKARYQEGRREAFQYLVSHPCEGSSRSGGTRTFAEIGATIKQLADRAGITPPGGPTEQEQITRWTIVGERICHFRNDGGPTFENVLLAMYRGRLDPCTYDPVQRYESVFLDDEHILEYSSAVFQQTFQVPQRSALGAFGHERGQCMLTFIETTLLGRRPATRR